MVWGCFERLLISLSAGLETNDICRLTVSMSWTQWILFRQPLALCLMCCTLVYLRHFQVRLIICQLAQIGCISTVN